MTSSEVGAATMRAALYDRYGTPDVLYVGQVPKPAPGPGEVLVEVHSASINSIDVIMRSGKGRLVSGLVARGFPKRVGKDYAGRVVALGPDVTGVSIGDPVWGAVPRGPGSAADYVVARPKDFAAAPAGLDLTEAGALPTAGATALAAVEDRGQLQPGERLLVRGATGGVGSVAIQLGRAIGAHVVGLASAKNLDLVRDLGAHDAFDYRTVDPHELGQFDVIIDTVGTDTRPFQNLLSPQGRMLTIAYTRAPFTSILAGRRRVRQVTASPHRPAFERLTSLVERGALRPVIDTTLPLADVVTAQQKFETGGTRGKVLLRVKRATRQTRDESPTE